MTIWPALNEETIWHVLDGNAALMVVLLIVFGMGFVAGYAVRARASRNRRRKYLLH